MERTKNGHEGPLQIASSGEQTLVLVQTEHEPAMERRVLVLRELLLPQARLKDLLRLKLEILHLHEGMVRRKAAEAN